MLNSPGFRLPEIKALFPALQCGFRRDDEAYRYRDLLRNDTEKFKKWQIVDLQTILAENNLVYMDRMSMANSLEVRVPLLDHNLVEFAFSLPDRFCIHGAERKYLLREYIRIQGLIHILDMPKRGFASPVDNFWPMASMLALLRQSHMVRDGLMHGVALEQILQQSRVLNYTYKILLLAVLEMWYRKWYE
jgi:asparagine synthase (glutamine-hydrolysing)